MKPSPVRHLPLILGILLGVNWVCGEGTDPDSNTSIPGLNYDLVAYYPFNGNANDESGKGSHGIVDGAALSPDRHGVSGKAYRFDGATDKIRIATYDSLNVGSRTVAAWFQTEVTGQYQEILYKLSNHKCEFGFRITPELKLAGRFETTGGLNGDDSDVVSITDVQPGSWMFGVHTWDSSTGLHSIYLDGILDNTRGTSGHTPVWSNSSTPTF